MYRKGLPILLLIILLGGALGCGPQPTAQPAPLARYMPADTVLFFSLLLRPEGKTAENWYAIRDAFAAVPVIQEGVDQFTGEAKASLPFDWKTEIDPWLGRTLAVGVTDLSDLWETASTGEEPPLPPFLLAAEVRDYAAWEAFLDAARLHLSQAGLTLDESDYEGTTIYNLPLEGEESELFFAVQKEEVLLASNRRTLIQEALSRKEKDSLAADETFSDLLDRLPEGALAMGYLSGAALAGLDQLAAEGGVSISSTWLAALRGIAGSVVAEEDGLRLTGVSTVDPAALAEAGLKEFYDQMRTPLAGRALTLLPKETAFTLIGQNLKLTWDMQMKQLQEMDATAYENLQGTLEDLAVETDLDVEEEILSWMTGEYALFLAPGKEIEERTALGIPSFQLGLLFQVKDQEAVAATMQKVEQVLVEEAGLPTSFYSEEIDGVDVRVIPGLETMGYLPGYAFVEDFLVIAIDRASFESVIQAGQEKGARLTAAEEFAAVYQKLPEKNTSLFYLDVGTLTRFLDAALEEPERSEFRKEAKPVLDLIGGVGAASTEEQDYTGGTIFVRILR